MRDLGLFDPVDLLERGLHSGLTAFTRHPFDVEHRLGGVGVPGGFASQERQGKAKGSSKTQDRSHEPILDEAAERSFGLEELSPHGGRRPTPAKARPLCEKALCLCGEGVFVKLPGMPTNLDLDEKLVSEALRVTGLRTKKALVEEGLRALIRLHQQGDVRQLRGMLHWQEPDPQAPDSASGRVEKAGKGRSGAGPR